MHRQVHVLDKPSKSIRYRHHQLPAVVSLFTVSTVLLFTTLLPRVDAAFFVTSRHASRTHNLHESHRSNHRSTRLSASISSRIAQSRRPATMPITSSSRLSMSSRNNPATPPKTRATAVYALILANLGVFAADNVLGVALMQRLYLSHFRWSWWQPLTTCFCHGDRMHLSSNIFLLLLFGRSVEDDLGWGGLLLAYGFCGVLASLVSLLLLPKTTVSIGASGAVFGLFAVSTLTKLSWRELLDWRKLVEVAVLAEFVFRQLASEIYTVAKGGDAGINHVAHLSGAIAGAVLVLGMRSTVARFEQDDKKMQGRRK